MAHDRAPSLLFRGTICYRFGRRRCVRHRRHEHDNPCCAVHQPEHLCDPLFATSPSSKRLRPLLATLGQGSRLVARLLMKALLLKQCPRPRFGAARVARSSALRARRPFMDFSAVTRPFLRANLPPQTLSPPTTRSRSRCSTVC
eukprot:Amastigsp_a184272_6.p3 type:complete len:144 gc:universal Amastigsp_a184272_6:469-900(+)